MFYHKKTVYKRLYKPFHINKNTTEIIENDQLLLKMTQNGKFCWQ